MWTLLLGIAMARAVTAADVTFTWSIEGSVLTGEVAAPTTGWVCVGFNDRSALAGARLVMGAVAGDTVTVEEHVADPPRHARRPGPSALSAVTATEADGWTRVSFQLDLSVGSPKLAAGQPVHLILAWSRDDDLQHHSARREHVDVTL